MKPATAVSEVAKAIKAGLLIRPTQCADCGKDCKPHAHHDDYGRPLDVRWLCASCHRRHHIKNGHAQNWQPGVGVMVRIKADLYEQIRSMARRDKRSIAAEVEWLLDTMRYQKEVAK